MFGGFLIDFNLYESIIWIGLGVFSVILLGPWVILLFIKSIEFLALLFFPRLIPKPTYRIDYLRLCEACGYRWIWKPGAGEIWMRLHAYLYLHAANVTSMGEEGDAARQRARSEMQRARVQAYLPLLRELQAHWQGAPDILAKTQATTIVSYEDYQRALGEPVSFDPGHAITGYVRRYHPKPRQQKAFMEAIRQLRGGDRAAAAEILEGLTRSTSQFVDPWLWLSALTDDGHQRMWHLEQAVGLDPAHPLAVDALALARGEISLEQAQSGDRSGTQVIIVRCPKCGGSLHHKPGTEVISCAYCGYHIDYQRANLLDAGAPLISNLRLQRQAQRHTWQESQQSLLCQACGAALTMFHKHLAKQCAYCGSTNVLIQDERLELMQPDGIVPFNVSQDESTQAIRAAFRSGVGKRDTSFETLEGYFVPFWMFDGTVEKQILFTWKTLRNKDRILSSRIDQKYQFDNLIFPAVKVPTPSLLDQLFPFGISKIVPYEPRFLADWPAQLYTQDVEWVVEGAYDTMLGKASQQSGPEIIRTSPAPAKRAVVSFQVSKTTYQLILLPVWVAMVRSGWEHRLVLVNGYAGKVVMSESIISTVE